MHIPLAVASDVVDVDVQDVGVLLHLTAGHGDQSVPVLLRQQLSHFAAAAGIESLSDDQEGVVLVIRRDSVDRGRGRLTAATAPFRRFQFRGELRECADVGRCGAAATADHLHSQVLHEVHQLHLQFRRRQTVMSHTADVLRKPGIGNAAHGEG